MSSPLRQVLRWTMSPGAIAPMMPAKSPEVISGAPLTGEHVVGLDPGFGGRAAGFGSAENSPIGLRHAETVREGRGHRVHRDTDPAAVRGSMAANRARFCRRVVRTLGHGRGHGHRENERGQAQGHHRSLRAPPAPSAPRAPPAPALIIGPPLV
jgi:hypothetical protein